jgi:DNA-nicking Smr family endonuclease
MTAESVWKMLIALKEARLNRQLANGRYPTDTLIDLIGYTALLAECLTEK